MNYKNWQAGDPLSADNLNLPSAGVQTAIKAETAQLEHNVVELYLENYFAGKSTPYQGLFFDGFSDTTKEDCAKTATLASQANSGQANAVIAGGSGILANDNVSIFDATNAELLRVQAIATAPPTQMSGYSTLFGDSGMLSSYNFDGNCNDAKGSNNGTPSGTSYDTPAGCAGQVVKFNANDAHVGYGNNLFRLNTTGYVAIFCTFFINSAGMAGVLADNSINGGYGETWSLQCDAGAGKMRIRASADSGGSAGMYQLSTVQTLVTGVRYRYVAILKSGDNNNWKQYLNGVDISGTTQYWGGATTASTVFSDGTTNLQLGALSSGGVFTEECLASIDNLSIMNRNVTGAEVTAYDAFMTADQITFANNLANTYVTGSVKRCTATVDTTNKQITPTASVGNGKTFYLHSKKQSFVQAMKTARLWLLRNVTVQYHPQAGVSAGATTVLIATDVTAKFANGDTISLVTANNITTERVTLTATPSYAGGNTTLTFTPALANAYTTADYVNRVDVIPSISIVASGASENFGTMTYVKTNVIVDNNNATSYREDEYSYTAGTAGNDVVIKLTMTRNDTSLTPVARRLGVSLNT